MRLPNKGFSDILRTQVWSAGQEFLFQQVAEPHCPLFKMKARHAVFCTLMAAGLFFLLRSAPAQGTAFTYQGLLNDGGNLANGSYDLQFTLYDAATNGNPLGAPVTVGAAPVTNGLFTVPLDFGGGVFGGQPRWLEIGVRTNGVQAGFTTLNPRQSLTAAPYAVTAANLSGVLPVSQLSGAIPVANVAGAQAVNVNLATNLTYTNYEGTGQALMAVTVGHAYIYYPNRVNGVYDGSYILGIVGTNCTDPNWFSIDPGDIGFLPPYQTSQVFVATQNTVTFVNVNSVSGPVADALFDLAAVTVNGTFNGIGQFNGNLSGGFSGAISNSVLAGNAQGGAVTNLDAAIANLRDYGQNLAAAFQVVTNAGGVIYNPFGYSSGGVSASTSQTYDGDASGFTGFNVWDSPIHIVGNGPALSRLAYSGTGASSNFFDSSAALFGYPGIDFSGVMLFNLAGVPGTGNNNGYISGPGGFGTLYWANDQVDQFNIGACISQSGVELDAFSANFNNVGLVLPFISDGAIVHDIRSFNNINAGIEMDSRGNNVFIDSGGDNIGVLIAAGGCGFVQTVSEGDTNSVICFGYPPSWPYTKTVGLNYNLQFAGNNAGQGNFIGPMMLGFGYTYPGPSGMAYCKIYSAPQAVDIFEENMANLPAVMSVTNTGDITPMTFHHVATGTSNLVYFSDGTFIPSCDGTNVGVNEPQLEFTKNVLKYLRDTNGNIFAAGNITATGVMSASAAQVGVLNVAATTPNSLLGTDAGNNMIGISLGTGLSLSGGTLSVTQSGGGGPLAGLINTYTSSHTATAQDGTILVNGFSVIITLPDASIIGAGTSYVIKLLTKSTTTIVPTGLQHIDNLTFYTLSAQYQYVQVQSDGNQWWIVGGN